jgi:hypothetical protein
MDAILKKVNNLLFNLREPGQAPLLLLEINLAQQLYSIRYDYYLGHFFDGGFL